MAPTWQETVVPDMLDNDIIPFWNALKKREFHLCRCTRCGTDYWPMALCPKHEDIGFDEMQWTPTSGRGKIFAWEVVHRAKNAIFQAECPYVLVLVELEEGPIFPTRLAGERPEGLRVGMPVEVVYEVVPATGMTLPLFRITDE